MAENEDVLRTIARGAAEPAIWEYAADKIFPLLRDLTARLDRSDKTLYDDTTGLVTANARNAVIIIIVVLLSLCAVLVGLANTIIITFVLARPPTP